VNFEQVSGEGFHREISRCWACTGMNAPGEENLSVGVTVGCSQCGAGRASASFHGLCERLRRDELVYVCCGYLKQDFLQSSEASKVCVDNEWLFTRLEDMFSDHQLKLGHKAVQFETARD
jgi:hypothetical protein